MKKGTPIVVGGVTVPFEVANNNCVRDAAHRLGYAIRKGFTDDYVATRRRQLCAWIDIAKKSKRWHDKHRGEGQQVG